MSVYGVGSVAFGVHLTALTPLFLTTTLGLTGFIIVTSMMADVVEDAAVSTGQRSEGLLFAATGLISKCVTGVGTFMSGLILAWVSFPQHATQGQVDPAILHHLGMVYVPISATCSAISIGVADVLRHRSLLISRISNAWETSRRRWSPRTIYLNRR
jgi:Na+/melibiose symporter-like transporter